MTDGESWLYRPLNRDKCRYESYKDGTLDLCDIARLNEIIDIEDENKIRIAEWTERNGRRN